MSNSLNGHAHLNGASHEPADGNEIAEEHVAVEVVQDAVDEPLEEPLDAAAPSTAEGNEREQLERELADTHEAIAAARQRLADREAAVKEALREELVASRERLAEMDRAHDVRITAIRAEADAAVSVIMRDESVETEGGA
jgi:phage terminase small subunit